MSTLEEVKITLIGNAGVGKTCIIARYIEDTFSEKNEPTIGVNYKEKVLQRENKQVQLNIWDTAGQEKYYSLGKHFYKESYIVILVYDITDQNSLSSLKTIWYPNLRKYGEEYTVLGVVGNKCDLYEKNNLANEEQAKAFAKEINASIMLTSAKTGDGIEKLFKELVDKYYSPYFSQKTLEMKRRRATSFTVGKNGHNKKTKKKCC